MSDMTTSPQTFDVRIGKRGTVVIPADVRRALDLEEGDTLLLTLDAERRHLDIEPVPTDPFERVRQAFKGCFEGVEAQEYVDQLREEWER